MTLKRIDSLVQRMDRGGMENLWAYCTDLKAILKAIAKTENELAVQKILSLLDNCGTIGKLGCAKTLIDLGEEKAATSALIELAKLQEEKNVKLASLAILGSSYYWNEKTNDEVEKFLNGVMDEDPDPDIIVAAAKSLWKVSSHRYRDKARLVLKDMLESDIQEIRVNAALALGEIRDIDAARSVLMEIQDDPSFSGRMAKILPRDWERVYGHPVYFLETFTDPARFKGTCYRAANWVVLGRTTGRGNNAPTHEPRVPIKEILAYPLTPRFRELLSGGLE